VPDQPAAPAGATPPAQPRRRLWPALLTVLVLAGVPLGAALLWQRVWLPLRAELDAQQRAQAELARRLDALEAWQTVASDDLAALETHSRELAARLDELEPSRLTAWALAEAEYLVLSAQRAAAVARQDDRAALALRLASANLTPVPASGPARRAIDAACSALEQVQMPNIGSLSRELARAADVLAAAPLREPGAPPAEAVTGGWRGAVQQAWQQLSDVIVVQRVGTPVQPLLRPHETDYLRQQLALKLAAADFALQRRDTEAFRRQLADLQTWVTAYLDTAAAATGAALATLARLGGVDLQPPLPDLSDLDGALLTLRRASPSTADGEP
jgi:uroporphyrin-3 C-methyltransferase